MLKTALVAMTIVGCDCDAKLCEFVSETPAQWASIAECETAVPAQLVRAPGLEYPLVTGICRAVPGPNEQKNETPATALVALEQEDARSVYELVRDKGGYVLDRTAEGYGLVKAGLAWTTQRVTPTVLAGWIPDLY